jgi:hypothetical protein
MARGLLDADGVLAESGRLARQQVEDNTAAWPIRPEPRSGMMRRPNWSASSARGAVRSWLRA